MAGLGAQVDEEPDITDAGWRHRENTKIWPNTTEGPVRNNPYTLSGNTRTTLCTSPSVPGSGLFNHPYSSLTASQKGARDVNGFS